MLNTRGGGDSPFLLLRTHQLAANLRAGVFPVRWMPDAAYGLGYPFFSYYAALPYYLAAGFTLVGLDILSAIKLTQTLFLAAAALAMYGWARQVLRSRAGGWLAAAAYTLAPFHLVNVYVRGDSLSEFAAFAFYPLILWSLDRLAARPSIRRALPPALTYAGLILTHNVSALIFSPFILLYVAFHILRFTFHVSRTTFHAPRTRLGKALSSGSLFIASLFIALLLSAWFWLPALAEIDDVQLTAQTSGYFFYGGHFRGSDLIQPTLIFDYTISPGSPSPFAMGLVQAVLASAGVLVVIVSWVLSQHATRNTQHATRFTQHASRFTFHASRFAHFATHRGAFILAGFTLSTYLITPLSRPLWDHLPLLPMVQFPWRFLSVQALFATLLTGALVTPIQGRLCVLSRARGWLAAIALTVLLGVAALAGLRPEYLPIVADEVTVERLQLYELFTGNVGSTIRYEYLPRWAVPRPHTGPRLFDPDAPPRAIPISGDVVDAERVAREPTRCIWQVEAGAGGAEIAFPLHYWPGWRARVDGMPVEVRAAAGSGYLTLNIPPGAHTVEIWLGRAPLRTVAELISLVTALALVALWGFGRRQGDKETRRDGEGEHATRNTQHASHPTFRFHVSRLTPFVLSAILLALLVAFAPSVGITGESDLTMDFERMPYLHHNPSGVSFDGWRMLGYRYSAEELAPGTTLRVTLDWEALTHGSRATLHLISPAAVRHDELPAMAAATAELTSASSAAPQAGSATLELPIPDDAPPGLHLLRLAGGEGAVPVYLRPVWVDSVEEAAGQAVRGAFAAGALRLHAVEATQSTPERLDVRLDWSAARPVAANYGLSLRLNDPAGNEWTRLDTQPGYGFLPTSLWPVDHLIHDRYALPLPPGTPPGEDYTLTVVFYRAATWESVGQATHTVSLPEVTTRPGAPTIVRLGDEIALSELQVPEQLRQGDTLRATAYWLAVKPPSKDYVAGWRLEATEATQVVSATLPLAPGSSPSDWPARAWIAGRAALPIPPTASPGDYELSLTLWDPVSGVPLGTYTYPRPISVRERERVRELPPMQREVGARFGGMIELAGYDFVRDEERLRLTLHWRALEVPDQHYMLFVHLADPATDQPVTQVDTMPRGFTYPTGLWAPGEVVSDEVVLSLEGVPAGRYDLAVGWYDPETRQRLPAVDRTGELQPGDRLILPDSVTLP